MSQGQITELTRRGVVAVRGADAAKFLNDLVTSDVPETAGGASFGALLNPQGKILFDFLVVSDGNGFLFDLPRTNAGDFAKRLTFYRLRAKVEIADLSAEREVVVAWGAAAAPILDGPVYADPRLPALGWRAIVPEGADMAADYTEARPETYDAHRIALGVPEGGVDFTYGDVYPHDVDMDQLAGVDFKKGCYVGQEVVSRMQHRGTARRRFVTVAAATELPPPGTPLTAGSAAIGTLGSSAGSAGLALVRLDRAKAAMDAGTPITAGSTVVTLTLPAWAAFGWPAGTAADS
jgi:folate-binding protein YgfZ